MLVSEMMKQLEEEFDLGEMRRRGGSPIFKFRVSVMSNPGEWDEVENVYCGANGLAAIDKATENLGLTRNQLKKADCIGYCDFYSIDGKNELFVEKPHSISVSNNRNGVGGGIGGNIQRNGHVASNGEFQNFMAKVIQSRHDMMARGEL